MAQKDRERTPPQTPRPPDPRSLLLWFFLKKERKLACGPLLIVAEEHKVCFQRGLVSMTQLLQRT